MKALDPVLRRAFRVGVLSIMICGAAGPVGAASRWATLEAIHRIENPRNLSRPGKHGELGAYQFRPSTWQMHTTIPFQRALDRKTSDIIAVKHYEWLKRGLIRAKIPVTPYTIALAWNAGLTAVTAGRTPQVAHEYAERAANLAAVYNRPREVATGQ